VHGWVQKKELYKNSQALPSSLSLNLEGRKSDTYEYDDILLVFI